MDTQLADMLGSILPDVAARPDDVLEKLSSPEVIKKILAFAATLTGEQWDKMPRPVRRLLGGFVRNGHWEKLLVAAGPDGRRLIWEVMERMLSSFARRTPASIARDSYAARSSDHPRDPRLDSSLAIKLAAGAEVARVLDSPRPCLSPWAVWPLLELAYESSPVAMPPLVPSLVAVEQFLMSAVPTVPSATTRRRGRLDPDMASYLTTIRQQLASSVAPRNEVIAASISNMFSPEPRKAHHPEDLVFRLFYVGVRVVYEHAGRDEPTAKDLTELWLCWDVEPDVPPKQIQRRWEDRIEPCRRYYEGINSTTSASSPA